MESEESGKKLMDTNVAVIGLATHELGSIRTLVSLLRHPDPTIPELARQALKYLTDAAGRDRRPAMDAAVEKIDKRSS